MSILLEIVDAGTMRYQEAWDLQLRLHDQVLAGSGKIGPDNPDADSKAFLMLVEHPPVVTVGRRANATQNIYGGEATLAKNGVEFIESDRGGDATFHGPGQLVAYPIINLNDAKLNLHSYMRFLEEIIIQTLAAFDIQGIRSEGATGVWTEDPLERAEDGLAKICAMGVKLRRWVTFHGLALNVSTNLNYFNLINPCGLSRPVTSIADILNARPNPSPIPSISLVKSTLAQKMKHQLTLPPIPCPCKT